MTEITRQDRKAAEELDRQLGPGMLDIYCVAEIISRHTRDGELRTALKKVCDSDWPSHLKAISEASALLAALDAEGGGKPNE